MLAGAGLSDKEILDYLENAIALQYPGGKVRRTEVSSFTRDVIRDAKYAFGRIGTVLGANWTSFNNSDVREKFLKSIQGSCLKDFNDEHLIEN